ncbi:4-carboxymuconolactone decarboxylase [Cryobacterium lactosi]|uniref:4-carboxymuconolactone decarboxylase n=1 Tax=Cryobacterium lactosi TaxID=1259202 RepID=A0A4R9BM38_9MICO|nr:4-carboxymuconolactone decarboxylase [Cryobacterium lactosi]
MSVPTTTLATTSVPTLIGTVTPVRGRAPAPPLVVLGPSLGTTTSLWNGVVGPLAATSRVLRFDLPGHGASPAASHPFTVAQLADAVIALVDSVGGGGFHYAGVSLGGAVGLELALRHPDRLLSLAVICSAPKIGTPEGWHERAAQIRGSGTPSVVVGSAERWFAPGFLERDPSAGSAALNELSAINDESYALCCEALAGYDVTDALDGIRTRTLCVSGEFDIATPTRLLVDLAAAIPGARHEVIAGAAHLPALERPAEVAVLLQALFAGPSPTAGSARTAASAYADGMTVRREVLGDAHVDRATAAITPETADFQDFLTRYAWGEIWTRPGLDRRTRSFLTIAALVTGGHEGELAMHVRAALTNGLSRAEISEAILHTAIYAGVPAANAAFTIARDTFAGLDAEPTNPAN